MLFLQNMHNNFLFAWHRWWQEADSPWQLLAVCFDLRAALSSGNPETYMSRIPVHQDGSCNGLQHYAALGRDESGGRAVNLLPVDKPQVSHPTLLSLCHRFVLLCHRFAIALSSPYHPALQLGLTCVMGLECYCHC